MSQITVPAAVLDNVVGFIELSSMTTKRALDEIGVHRAAQEKAAALRPALLDHMLKSKVVQAHQKEAADAMLGSHPESLQLLKAATDKIVELNAEIQRLKAGGTKQAGDLGAGVDGGEVGVAAGGSFQGTGEYNSLTHPIVGEKTAFVRESDRKLAKGAGVNL